MIQFSCPFCKRPQIDRYSDFLFCPICQVQFPVIDGIVFFTEPSVLYSQNQTPEFVTSFLNQDPAAYTQFLKEKGRRTAPDLYAAFQPFNESSRAFEAFIPFLKKNLKPGDVILDTWCRTGWSSLYLSGLFPEQKILSVWEGNKGVLGYQGFLFWFGKDKRPDNLEIMFADINQTLPLPDQSVRLVYGLDTLHRYKKPNVVNELMRVSAQDGFIIFPHVHLNNGRPDPFFERGGDIKLGSEWDFYLTKKLAGTNRKHFIFSEPALFETPEKTPFVSTPEMEDYNGLVCIFPDSNLPAFFWKMGGGVV